MKYGVRGLLFLFLLSAPLTHALSRDREAFAVAHYDLNIQIDPSQQRLGVRGKITLRNDSASLQKTAVLQISSYLPEAGELTLDMLPGTDASALLLERKTARPKAELKTILAEMFPARLAQALLPEALQKQVIAETSNKSLKELGDKINSLRLRPTGTEGFAKAEVTVGGVDTAGLSSQTMGATAVPGLFVIGEAVDVTGWLGGYNFQWAWSSGFAAGSAA